VPVSCAGDELTTTTTTITGPSLLAPVFLLVLALHTCLPMPPAMAVAAAALNSLCHLAATVLVAANEGDKLVRVSQSAEGAENRTKVFLPSLHPQTERNFFTPAPCLQVASNALLLCSGHVVGLYFQRMTASAREHTFERTRSCVESRVRLECEKEHQEQLLLSVIPAHIAAEVKRNIMARMTDEAAAAKKDSGGHKGQRFQEMYVQRHNNVR